MLYVVRCICICICCCGGGSSSSSRRRRGGGGGGGVVVGAVFLSVCLSIYLAICKLENEASLRGFLNFSSWQDQKGSNSARLPQFLNWTTSKTKQFCETSSIFELDNVKNEAILRDFLQKWKVECRAGGLLPMCFFAIFPLHLSKVLRLSRKSDARSYDVLHLSRKTSQNHLSKPEDLMLQNATFPRKSAAWPPNISDENVSCIAPATQNPSLQILFTCPTPANFFLEMLQSLHFGRVKNPLRLPHKRRFNIQKWREHVVFCTFWLRHVLRAATTCTFCTSQLPKGFWTWRALYVLTSKCALRHNGVGFFNISTSKSAPDVRWF